MDIDDIYSLAVEGDVDGLKEALSTEEAKRLLNIPIDTDDDEGTKMKFSVLLSILAGMSDSGYNFEVLDVLAEAGIDVNMPVELVYSSGLADVYPLTKRHFNEPKVLEWFLKNGANPDAVELVEAANGKVEDVTLLTWAIKEDAEEAVKLLLKYGANPSKPSHPLPAGSNQLQMLRPLYYSLLETHNTNITAMLYKAGAYTDERVDFTKKFGGYGNIGDFVKRDKLAMKVHGQALNMKDNLPDYEVIHVYDPASEENAIEDSTVVRLKTLTRMDQEESRQINNQEIKKDNGRIATATMKKKCYIKFQAYLAFQGIMIGIALFFMCFLSEPSDKGIWIALTVVDWLFTIGITSPTVILAKKYGCNLLEVLLNYFVDGLFIFFIVIFFMMIIMAPIAIVLIIFNKRRDEIHFKDQYGQDHYGYVDENNNYEEKYTGETGHIANGAVTMDKKD